MFFKKCIKKIKWNDEFTIPNVQGPRNGFYLGVARSNTDFWTVNFQKKNSRVNPEI